MLEVANSWLTKVPRGLWCILAALMAGSDQHAMAAEVHEIMTSKEVIAANQDQVGRPAGKFRDCGDLEIRTKELSGHRTAYAVLNRIDQAKPASD